MNLAWRTGTTPWVRREQPNASYGPEPNPVLCYFCGSQTMKRSSSDVDADHGRIEMYCDSQMCQAREVIIIIRRDGAGAHRRADVRALRALDGDRLDIDTATSVQGGSASPYPSKSVLAARRQTKPGH